jgi:hypothetical protein
MRAIPGVPALPQMAAVAKWLAPVRAPAIGAAPDFAAAQVSAIRSWPWPNR